ncbi:hypothetical protein [Haliscomenobacter hydrossis]|uniref:hypothetical protein n=1 Tax=Haliscomenobacter hydrossis TaxID=2350 RepID=UPI0011D29114|nr:hypothetical protein [Haliscomenobacter hydrossis]
MQNTKKDRQSPFTIDHQTLADIQSCSLANTAPVSQAPANIPDFQTHNSEHCCTDTLPLYPPIRPEPGFDECSLLFAKLLWVKPAQWDDCLVSKIDKCWNLIYRQNSTLRFWISATYF